MLDFTEIHFEYEPYPIGLAANIFGPEQYAALCATYPPKELFEFKPELGNKYSLSEINNADQYHKFIHREDTWRNFYEYVKSDTFIPTILAFLVRHNIDLGLGSYRVVSRKSILRGSSLMSRLRRIPELSSRFEFSMMGADGGYILPHTDAQKKLVTLVVSMIRKDEWNPAWGGGTAIMRPHDRRLNFNRANKYLSFDDVEVLKEWDFKANQCVIFVKTFNSWHAVSPMKGPIGGVLRKTLTINIEEKH